MADSDEERVLAFLRRLGATDDELAELGDSGRFGDFALELVLRTAPPLDVRQAAAAVGVTPEEFRRVWQTLGLATPEDGVRRIPADLVEMLPVVAAAGDWMGEDAALGLARVVGSATARLAEALVDIYRVAFEVPHLQSGTSYAEVVEQQVALTQAGIADFERFVTTAFRAHLRRASWAEWAPDVKSGATRRELFVAFVDMVGYTALARTMTLGELATLLRRFEDTVGDVVAAGGGRLVKLIGDSAMFVVDAPADGCRLALEVADALGALEAMPAARIGADCGSVLALHGDYFGDVVNRAARLVAVANPSTIVVSDAVQASCGAGFRFERLPARALKGFRSASVTYRLLAR